MVSSNHSFWCSALASRTPHGRMWENSSSRACSKGVGVDILRGSARFLAMPRGAPLCVRTGNSGGAGTAGALQPSIHRRRNVIGRVRPRKGRTCGPTCGIIIHGQAERGGRRRSRHVTEGRYMSDHSDEVYGPDRAERLLAMLRALAERIQALDRAGQLLERVPELQKLMGNTRSELFHYEVRLTYDTPEVAESRRIVEEAERQAREARAGFDDDEDDEPWRGVPGE